MILSNRIEKMGIMIFQRRSFAVKSESLIPQKRILLIFIDHVQPADHAVLHNIYPVKTQEAQDSCCLG